MTERILYLEPVGGIAGDMFLAAALDLGVPLDALEAALRSLGLEGWHFEVTRATRHGIVGTHVEVVVDSEALPSGVVRADSASHRSSHAEGSEVRLADLEYSDGGHTQAGHPHSAHGAAGPTHAERSDAGQPSSSHVGSPHTQTEHSHAEQASSSHIAPARTHAEPSDGEQASSSHIDPARRQAEHSNTPPTHQSHAGHHERPDSTHNHEAYSDAERASSSHIEEHSDGGPAAHSHRSWREIDALIRGSRLPERAKLNALEVFRLLGEAEAKVHGVSLEEIHFHEVGAVDSIVDICGAAMALELLGNPRVLASPPPLGSGTARISHGVVPVPVPATLELLRGVPVRFEGKGELTTPTGAALLKAFATVGPPPELIVERIGYGVGTKDWPDRANVLRASLATTSGESAATLVVLECNLDDCSPQVLGALVETLVARGALDAWIVPVVMKKGRPGHLVGVLATQDTKEALETTLLEESTTLGVRQTQVTRTALERRWETVTTRWGPVRVKLGLRGTRVLNAAPEFEDCRALAQKAGVPLKDVQAAAVAAFRRS